MTRIDFKKELKHLYNPSAKSIVSVNVPPMHFLMVDGHGNPNTSTVYAEAVEALYTVAYALKFKVKKCIGVDYGVMPLEGLWWADDPVRFITRDKDSWQWTMMIMQPKFVTSDLFKEVIGEVEKKKRAALHQLRFDDYHEGSSAQILYVGPYDGETQTIADLHTFIHQHGYGKKGKHHEIYLNDPRKTAPEKLKTVIRQPFQ
jgi:hypothetical protein